jgi:hypothetical protein
MIPGLDHAGRVLPVRQPEPPLRRPGGLAGPGKRHQVSEHGASLNDVEHS